jgi:predicted deacylase
MTAASFRRSQIPVFTLANGHQVELVVHEVVGGDGPSLGVIGGVHGDEPLSLEVVRRVLDGLDGSDVRGSVLALPCANPYAYQALTRNTPLDMTNLNRVFPGDPDGMLSEQLAHRICERFLPRCDYLIDLHSGGNLATVDYVYIHDDSSELARAFGLELMYRGSSYPGSLGNHARRNGVPTVVSELGGGGQRDERYIARGVRGVRNVMKKLGMLDGEPELPERQWIVDEMRILRPHQGGMLVSEVGVDRLGERVPRHTVLGRVLHPQTFEVLEVVEAPFEPSIMVLTRESVTKVDPGDYGYMVANGATAVPA